ncbi:MAG TPA: response regulator transcription factor, partial [Herpetosiphonaceae bacterium]|nr:response regulator transcription factor [Herpetosiphonaceae bacterium]
MTQASGRILVVDDEMPIRMTMGDMLRRRGFEVEVASSGEEALDIVFQRPFDLLLLDLKLPQMDGIEVAHRARERQPDVAVIILTGHGSLESAIDGLRMGVFDYMLKTTSPQEVIARVGAAIAKRHEERNQKRLMDTLHTVIGELHGAAPPPAPPAETNEQWITVGDLQISSWRQTARLGDQILSLTPTEFRILVCLAQQAGHVMTYQQLLRCAQGYEAESYEAAELVKPHIYHLRQKIEPDSGNPRYILTVRGT